MMLRPKGWDKFQHYKDRCPPWIKLHRDLLINRDFMCLPIASKALAPMLWLLASEAKDGVFDASFEELQFRLHISEKDYQDGVKSLIDKGFFEITSGMLAECKQVAIPETEKRERQKVEKPESVSDNVWSSFVQHRKQKKAVITDLVLSAIAKEAEKAGWTLDAAMTEMVTRNWTGFKADWVKTEAAKKQTAQDRARAIAMGTNL